MEPGESYRLNAETLGITHMEPPRTAVMVPKGGIVTILAIVAGPLAGNRMIDVIWNGKTVMLFAQDLRKRGELVDGAKP